jgi:hypothetical protein
MQNTKFSIDILPNAIHIAEPTYCRTDILSNRQIVDHSKNIDAIGLFLLSTY